MSTATQDDIAVQRPTLAEVDVFGLTHPGLVRRTNADHFLVASLHRTLHVRPMHAPAQLRPVGAVDDVRRGRPVLVVTLGGHPDDLVAAIQLDV